jgi:hypothetical protein
MPWDSPNGDNGRGPLDKHTPLSFGWPRITGAVRLLLAAILTAAVAFYALTFHVNPDELGVVMRFGKVDRQEPPGLHFRMPYPIDVVHLPKVTRQNIIEVGMRTDLGTRTGTSSTSTLLSIGASRMRKNTSSTFAIQRKR